MSEMSLVDLGKKLLESSRTGDTEEVRALMTNGAPFTTDWLGVSPLHMAAQFGHTETAEVLLRGGISRDARTKVDRTPLHIAAQEGYLDIVKLLINHGAEIDARDMLKMTPLHWAVDRGHHHVVTFLIMNNADVNALSKFDKTPLDIAMEHQNMDIMSVLHKQAVDPAPTQSKAKIIQLNSVNPLPTFKTNVPLILKTESLSNVIQKTLAQTVHIANPVTSATSMSPELANSILEKALKTQTVTKPVVLRANVANFQKPSAACSSFQNSSSSDSDEGESSEQSNSNVLTTLAALAEATASNSSLSNAEAMKWLEKHGITMLPTDNSTIMASALEGGQTVTLTEAGKLALTWVKEQSNLNNNSVNPPASQNSVPTTITSSLNSTPTQMSKEIGGHSCSIGICQNTSINTKKKGLTVRFFCFPKDRITRRKWILKCHRGKKINPDTARVCSVHFTEKDYEDGLKAKLMGETPIKLKRKVVPSLLISPPSPHRLHPQHLATEKQDRVVKKKKRTKKPSNYKGQDLCIPATSLKDDDPNTRDENQNANEVHLLKRSLEEAQERIKELEQSNAGLKTTNELIKNREFEKEAKNLLGDLVSLCTLGDL